MCQCVLAIKFSTKIINASAKMGLFSQMEFVNLNALKLKYGMEASAYVQPIMLDKTVHAESVLRVPKQITIKQNVSVTATTTFFLSKISHVYRVLRTRSQILRKESVCAKMGLFLRTSSVSPTAKT